MLPCFFFNDTATTEIYTLSLHDALPISQSRVLEEALMRQGIPYRVYGGLRFYDRQEIRVVPVVLHQAQVRSEEHTSELQSRPHLVCRLLLEKKKKNNENNIYQEILMQ